MVKIAKVPTREQDAVMQIIGTHRQNDEIDAQTI
jgi:hypothetical protein